MAEDGPDLESPSIAWDSQSSVLLLIGANGSSPCGTYEWRTDRWVQVQDMGPKGPMSLMSTTAGVVAYGQGATWLWASERWQQIQDMGPTRDHPALAWDAERGCGVLFGGSPTDGAPVDETWVLKAM